jgi:hypothetical protein
VAETVAGRTRRYRQPASVKTAVTVRITRFHLKSVHIDALTMPGPSEGTGRSDENAASARRSVVIAA